MGIHVFATPHGARRDCVDSRIKLGQDELVAPCTIRMSQSTRARAVRDDDLEGKNARFVTPPNLVALVEWADKVLGE